jgi:hypothetical protein
MIPIRFAGAFARRAKAGFRETWIPCRGTEWRKFDSGFVFAV